MQLPTIHDLLAQGLQLLLSVVSNKASDALFGGLALSAIVSALPDPDHPEDWEGPHWRYRIFFRAINNFIGIAGRRRAAPPPSSDVSTPKQ